jgi:hypothetical protein
MIHYRHAIYSLNNSQLKVSTKKDTKEYKLLERKCGAEFVTNLNTL